MTPQSRQLAIDCGADREAVELGLVIARYYVDALGRLLLVLVVIVGIVGLVFYRRARRDGRWSPLVLALKLETTPPGPRREVLKLRLRLQRALFRARRAVATSAREGRPVGDLAGLLERAERAAAIIDQDLRILGPDDDRATLRERLGVARSRIDEFEQVTSRLAETASLALGGEVDGSLAELRSDADRELVALRAGVDSLDRIGAGDAIRLPTEPSSAQVASRRT